MMMTIINIIIIIILLLLLWVKHLIRKKYSLINSKIVYYWPVFFIFYDFFCILKLPSFFLSIDLCVT